MSDSEGPMLPATPARAPPPLRGRRQNPGSFVLPGKQIEPRLLLEALRFLPSPPLLAREAPGAPLQVPTRQLALWEWGGYPCPPGM